jgi:hypothetical protein
MGVRLLGLWLGMLLALNQDLVNPSSIQVDHLEPHTLPNETLPRSRNVLQLLEHKAGQPRSNGPATNPTQRTTI